MAQRRFGPTVGAGTVVIEKDAEKLLAAASLGVTVHFGIYPRGEVGKLISTLGKKQFVRKTGGFRIDESLAPDAGLDFWDLSGGAGELHLVRLDDGTGVKAALTLFDREDAMQPIGTITAKGPGRAYGRGAVVAGEVANSAAITNTAITTGKTMLKDQYKGGTFYMDGVSGKSYEVIGNTTAGVLSLRSDAKAKTDYTASGTSDLGWYVELPQNDRLVEILIDNGERDPDSEFSLVIFVDGQQVKKFGDLSLDPSSDKYAPAVINAATDNDWITYTDLNAPQSVVPRKRPAIEQGRMASLTKLVLTKKIFEYSVSSAANPTVTLGATNTKMRYRDKITVTFSSSTAATVVSERFGAQGSLTLSGGPPLTATFTPKTPLLPTITITNGGTAIATSAVITIYFFPMAANVHKGSYLVPDHLQGPLNRFRIAENDEKSYTILSGDLLTAGKAGSGTIACSTTAVTGTDTAFTSELEVGDMIVAGGEARIVSAVANDTGATLDSAFTSDPSGAEYRIVKRFMVVGKLPLAGGYDGISGINDATYQAAMDPATSLIRRLKGQRKGLVKIATPGKYSTAVQKAGAELAQQLNYQYRIEFPPSIADEQSAVEFVNSTLGRNDFLVGCYPTYVNYADPDRPGLLKQVSTVGAIQGREALVARTYNGYHRVAAGVDVTLPRVAEFLSDAHNDLNEEVLNAAGIQTLKFIGGNCVVWGARTLASDPAWKWKQQRELMSHYENQLLESFDWVIFALNDPETQGQLITALRSFFIPEWQKRALRGATFDAACSIKIDSENNTDETRAAGDLFAEIELRLADTTERFVINMSKAGVAENVA